MTGSSRALLALVTLTFLTPPVADAGPRKAKNIHATQTSGSVHVAHTHSVWDRATAVTYDLIPLNDPKWKAEGRGPYPKEGGEEADRAFKRPTLSAKSIYNESDISFLISWEDPAMDLTVEGVEDFVDAVSIAFDAKGMCHMGDLADPTNIWNVWYWRADKPNVENLLSAGVGTITRTGDDNISAIAEWSQGWWHVVLTRSRTPGNSENQSDLTEGNLAVRFARWDGGRDERNGTKWITAASELELDR